MTVASLNTNATHGPCTFSVFCLLYSYFVVSLGESHFEKKKSEKEKKKILI